MSPNRTASHEVDAPPIFKRASISSVDTSSPRATRSQKDSRDLFIPANRNESLNENDELSRQSFNPVENAKEHFNFANEIQNAADEAKGRLGLQENLYKPPPSSNSTSSLPLTTFDNGDSDSGLSSPPPETPELSPTQKNIDYVNNATLDFTEHRAARCPLCNEAIDRDFFDSSVGLKRLTVRQQEQFCRIHKKHSAEVTWEKQGYPKIDWHQLNEGLQHYYDAIDEILQGKRSSFYRNAFEDSMKSRKDRTLRKNLMEGEEVEGSSPGYYGSRGAKLMFENPTAVDQ